MTAAVKRDDKNGVMQVLDTNLILIRVRDRCQLLKVDESFKLLLKSCNLCEQTKF